MVRRLWKSDGFERPPIAFERAIDDLWVLNKEGLTKIKIERKLRDGEVVSSPCADYEMVRCGGGYSNDQA